MADAQRLETVGKIAHGFLAALAERFVWARLPKQISGDARHDRSGQVCPKRYPASAVRVLLSVVDTPWGTFAPRSCRRACWPSADGWPGDEAKLFIIDNQLARRNVADIDRVALTERAREIVAAQAKARHQANGGDKKPAGAILPPPVVTPKEPKTRAVMAKSIGMAERTYDAHRTILEAAKTGEIKPEVVEDVRLVRAGGRQRESGGTPRKRSSRCVSAHEKSPRR
jgi:hypothetical protein